MLSDLVTRCPRPFGAVRKAVNQEGMPAQAQYIAVPYLDDMDRRLCGGRCRAVPLGSDDVRRAGGRRACRGSSFLTPTATASKS